MADRPAPTVTAHEFVPHDYVGGHPVLDFVNTVTARNASPIDWLDDYDALLRWARGTGLFVGIELPTTAASRPTAAVAELRRCKQLREALHAMLLALATDGPVPTTATAVLQADWRRAASRARLDVSTGSVRLRHPADRAELTTARRTLAFAAVDFVETVDRDRLRVCRGPHCGWLFLDSSKAGRRRWCDMATCGTAAKSRRRRAATGH